jgi:hypothetical protein
MIEWNWNGKTKKPDRTPEHRKSTRNLKGNLNGRPQFFLDEVTGISNINPENGCL